MEEAGYLPCLAWGKDRLKDARGPAIQTRDMVEVRVRLA